jgi:hypothetical protein
MALDEQTINMTISAQPIGGVNMSKLTIVFMVGTAVLGMATLYLASVDKSDQASRLAILAFISLCTTVILHRIDKLNSSK